MVFRCGSHLAPSGSRKSCLHAFNYGTIAWHICSCCKVFSHLLLYSVVCPLPFHTSGSSSHFLTKAKCFHWQGMLHGILGDDTWICSWYQGGHACWTDAVLFFSLRLFIYIFWAIWSLSWCHFLTLPLLLSHFRSLSTIGRLSALQMRNFI
jgi:hypothetical protein